MKARRTAGLLLTACLGGGVTWGEAFGQYAARLPYDAERVGEGVPAFGVRSGYRVTIAADGFGQNERVRFLETDGQGTVFVSMPQPGKIVAMRDGDGDGVFERRTDFVEGYPSTHGMHWHDGWLWFTQTGAIHKARDTTGDGVADEIVTVIPEGDLPSGGGHWWRSIAVTADGEHLFTSIGDSGNITDETDTDRQKVWRYATDGSGKTLWSTGVRNTEKLRFRPENDGRVTNELWGADHGSDWFGRPVGDRQGRQPITDLNPPDEFNRYVEGGFYGHPFIVGNKLPRYEFLQREDIIDLAHRTVPPAWSFGPHWASNGFAFLTTDGLGEGHAGDALVAFHGSWNRRERAGYRVERILFDDATGLPYGTMQIVNCLDEADGVLARPVDVVELPDGDVLFSCSQSRRVFRIEHAGD